MAPFFFAGTTLIRSPEFDLGRARWHFSSANETHPAAFAPGGSNRSSHGGNDVAQVLAQRVTREAVTY